MSKEVVLEVGDKVRVINYGHQIWEKKEKDSSIKIIDISPDIVGKVGVVSNV